MTSEEALSKLCAAFRCYSFPPVTFDFRKYPDGPYANKPEKGRCLHEDMRSVEECIRKLLHSKCRQDARDGLSNVLYWGWAQAPANFEKARVDAFRQHVTDDQLSGFIELVQGILDGSGHAGDHLHDLRRLELPQFSGLSFMTKILMFLDPCSFPVLDRRIAKAFANHQCKFPPLQGLNYERLIRPTHKNRTCYEQFAQWTQKTAKRANEALGSSCGGRSMRAVDVERALFTLSDWWKRDKALTMLAQLSHEDSSVPGTTPLDSTGCGDLH